MSNAYRQLLDAAIRDLEDQKSRGVRHVKVSGETLAALSRPVSTRAAAPSAPRAGLEFDASSAAAPKSAPAAPAASAVPIRKPVFKRAAPVPANLAPVAPPSIPDPAPAPELPPLDPAAKAVAFAELRERALACVKCPHLASSRKTVVFGVGDPDSPLMFVGEAPGADEDELGEPFVGAAGQLLTRIIQAMGERRDTVYIANILKCRPDTHGQSSGNRKPTPEEMQTCIPWLQQQIDIIRPRVLVALGVTAVEGLLGKTPLISKLRGHWQTYRGIPLMPTYHPAYLLHNQSMSEKRKVWEDMLAVMEKLQRPISEKQRGYFSKAT